MDGGVSTLATDEYPTSLALKLRGRTIEDVTGGNVGAVAAGFLFKASAITWPQALLVLGLIVTACASLALLVRFAPAAEKRDAALPQTAGLATGD